MVGTAVWLRSRGRIQHICESAGDARELRLRLLEEIRRVVGFDAYAFLLTDPETSVGSLPLADVPCLRELPRLIRLKYLTALNRWTTLKASAPVALLQEATGGDPSHSLLWRELLREYRISDVASTVFRDRSGCWGFLDLWRSDAAARFSPAEAAYLAHIADAVTGALRRCQADTFKACGPHPPRPGPVVLLLSGELQVLGQTPETHEYLRVLVPPERGRTPIPATAYNVAAQLLAFESGVDSHPPSARVHLSDGLWLTLRAARIGSAQPPGTRGIAVTIEEASPRERVEVFTRAFGLSAREAEVLGHLVAGADTREVAGRMFLSEYTVQDHLKSVFSKTAVHSRRALLARALGS
ncbi:helix-turn-helix transcriptional regulator [Nocardiopsis lambiniae]|uniref:Helix-turn-helix transcriptional regulator n=1 Tax=Nocardiopsis lambiniae TaxID=3075539 RepID=A0ABU2M4F5_9ACTN|nr:helix-turn-helix transcriptional regulator [Nocardiopsis sp. DSM 44743]MDT0326886.1 helix-turn-helix transcriptional regulator [Nocardiopsis sp. DSM 44743]